MVNIKAIETQYKGYRFRSRLEARWAVFFDALGLKWEYEPEGYDLGEGDWYLPDFYLKDWGMWAEVKPDVPNEGEIRKMWKLSKAFRGDEDRGWREHVILCGTPGKPSVYLGTDDPPITVGDGYAALTVAGGLIDDKPLVVFSCFAMVNGGKDLHIWPMYGALEVDSYVPLPCKFFPEDVRGNDPDLISLTWFHGFVRRLYAGDGVQYYRPNLMMAYQAARSARFEREFDQRQISLRTEDKLEPDGDWSAKEDLALWTYFQHTGGYFGFRRIDRKLSADANGSRIRFLRESGLWDRLILEKRAKKS